MKPTPRTDAEWPEGSFVDAKDALKFARDLERQLSDALEREKALQKAVRVLLKKCECAEDGRDDSGYYAGWNND